ncbi:hypothetical protein [Kosakonia oryzae]|uniref:Uncharacterized protein n=1 Tax=Kosakonia oryzae TaxID=497725 RepID=A0AA94H1N6_9ENTR|nr:hypothetical protein [Kosakonia oryzae]ANI83320.1 hypothetical protein AWR26_14570 [Kosakonia oryzae]SFC02539.1 hypothetical protein SAMN05216286_1338 [Kosakonia oryzae]
MKTSLFFAFLPIIISVLSLWTNYIHGSNKSKTSIIDNLSKELSNKKPTPYIIQACVSRIHNSRAIPFNILKKLLHYNNALEIIQLVSVGRKILDIFKLSESNNNIVVEYSDAYSTLTSRLTSMLLCLVAILIVYSTSVYLMLEIMVSIGKMNSIESENLTKMGSVIFDILSLIFLMFMTFVFSWQFIIIFTSKKRIIKIQKLINDNYPFRSYRKKYLERSLQKKP